jgi:hypothetical protein
MQLLRRFTALTLAIGTLQSPTVRAASQTTFSAAYIHPENRRPVLTLFPSDGPAVTLPLPDGLPESLTVNAFSPDGKAVYLQKAELASDGSIIKVEFKPARQSIVPGTVGLGTIWNLTVARPSGRIYVSGISKTRRQCGTFEIDPDSGDFRTLLIGAFPNCGGGGGAISPDGKRVISYSSDDLSVIDLETHAVEALKGIAGKARQTEITWPQTANWSPDGRWMSVALPADRILLIDATDLSKRKRLGHSGGPMILWSPDSRYLLLSRSQFRCALYLFFDSLESVEVATGKRRLIHSSQCEVGGGWFGWLNSDAVQ